MKRNRVNLSGLALVFVLALGSAQQARSADFAGDSEKSGPKTAMKDQKVKKGKANMEKKGFIQDIEKLAIQNDNFRKVVYTATHCQIVLMSLKPQEEIGEETHVPDQFFRVEAGSGVVVLNGVRTDIHAGSAILVPSGAKHNIINTGHEPMKLYTIYSPPNHRDGVIHQTRADAEKDNEHFDGKTTE